MYAYIKGKVAYSTDNTVVIDCGGVGYEILTTKTAAAKAEKDAETTMFTYLSHRDDDMTLFGFPSIEEKGMFIRLTGISGIGPKAALSILSDMSAAEIASAVITGDAKAFSRVNGVGKKTAERIILEMRDKINAAEAVGAPSSPSAEKGAVSDAVEGLIGLGYTRSEAVAAVNTVKELADTPEDMMILALKRIGM